MAPHAIGLQPSAAASSGRTVTAAPVTSVKILVAGGFGVGKTTFVGTISEITPLRTEEVMTEAGVGVDDVSGVPDKTTTTVAMDFGRISIDETLILYLFGTPGQDRFGFMWDELCKGAIGAVALADTRRLGDCFAAVDYMEHRGVPYVVVLNVFADASRYDLAEVRRALRVPDHVPLLSCDARSRGDVRQSLVALVEYALTRRRRSVPGG
ncbi:ATP/GTP-binding protein [Dactylosporangium sp. NPDC005572]|uniref:GTP-binding protein n=1 Tax=Dactylosporangium sp. NPDC005572 TaxID=3156889 RepID=UPI0033B01134